MRQRHARTCVEELLPYLAEDTAQSRRMLQGARDPSQIFLTAYRVLQRLNDPRADNLLRQGHAHLQACADRISDAALRRQFVENVPVHRALLEEAVKILSAD